MPLFRLGLLGPDGFETDPSVKRAPRMVLSYRMYADRDDRCKTNHQRRELKRGFRADGLLNVMYRKRSQPWILLSVGTRLFVELRARVVLFLVEARWRGCHLSRPQ